MSGRLATRLLRCAPWGRCAPSQTAGAAVGLHTRAPCPGAPWLGAAGAHRPWVASWSRRHMATEASPSSRGEEQPPPGPSPPPLQSTPAPRGAAGLAGLAPPVRSAAEPPTAEAAWNGVRISPKKLARVVDLVRGLSVEEAFAQLQVAGPQRGAAVTAHVLTSAKANAVHNLGLDASRLRIQSVVVTKGTYLKRIKYHARGRSGVMHHPKARLRVVLEEVALNSPLSRKVAVHDSGGATPAWVAHREKRAQRADRMHRLVARAPVVGQRPPPKKKAAAAVDAGAAATRTTAA